MIKYTEDSLYQDVYTMSRIIIEYENKSGKKFNSIYAVPRGGVPFGAALSSRLGLGMVPKQEIDEYTLIVDDIIDSGKTRFQFKNNYFACIHMKGNVSEYYNTFTCHINTKDWVHYFWEGESETATIEDAVIRQLQYIGEDIKREGLIETPQRVIKAWNYLFSGYNQSADNLITTFDSEEYDEIVLLKDIEMYSMCEHHLLPFFGKAHIAYIPDKKVIGVSKLARILEMYSRRAQIQERIGNQVTNYLMECLKPKAAACIIEAQHLCMLMRGVQKQNSVMVTSSLKGAFLDRGEAKTELMSLIKN